MKAILPLACLLLLPGIAIADNTTQQTSFLTLPSDPNDNSLNAVAPAPATGNVGDGFYIGMQGGLASQIVKSYSYAWGMTIDSPASVIGARLGYGHTFNNQLYLGGMLEGNWQDVDAYNNAPSTSTQVSKLFSASIVPGYHFAASDLLYGKVGVGRAYYTSNSYDGRGNPYDTSSSESVGVLGLGYSTAISSNLTLGLEYDYYYFIGSISPIHSEPDWYQRINDQMYLLNINYQFDDINTSAPAQRAPLKVTGPYIGASAGMEAMTLTQTQLRDSTNDNSFPVNSGDWGFDDNVHIGYSYGFNPFYLGLEAWAGTHSTSVVDYGPYQAREKYSYGINLVPGYLITPSDLFYIKAGPQWTQIQGSDGFSDFNQNVRGWLYGLGFETALSNSLSLNIEYDRLLNDFDTSHYEYYLQSNQISLGLNYRF